MHGTERIISSAIQKCGSDCAFRRRPEYALPYGYIDYLLKELKDYGFDYEFYFNESEVWFLLELNNEVSDKRLMDKISRDRALIEEFEKLKSQELDN